VVAAIVISKRRSTSIASGGPEVPAAPVDTEGSGKTAAAA
jgi:hypothetical protein